MKTLSRHTLKGQVRNITLLVLIPNGLAADHKAIDRGVVKQHVSVLNFLRFKEF